MPTFDHTLRVARLRYTLRLVQHGGLQLRALVEAEASTQHSWLSMLMTDLAWLQRFHPPTNIPAHLDPSQIWSLVQDRAHIWTQCVRAASRAAMRHAAAAQPGLALHPTFVKSLVAATPKPVALPHACSHCDATFATLRQLRGHHTRKHGYRRPQAAYADTTHCKACML